MEITNEENKAITGDLKVVLIGNVSTGKTSILDRYIENVFKDNNKSTISPNYSHKLIKRNNSMYRLQFWDIPGQDRSPTLTNIFCKDANGIIFCCEVNNKKSKDDILLWKKSLVSFINIDNIPIILMENKCDLLGDESNYNNNIEEIKNFSENNKFSGAFRTSALNGYNIENAMNFLIDEIIRITDNEHLIKDKPYLSTQIKSKIKEDKNQKCC